MADDYHDPQAILTLSDGLLLNKEDNSSVDASKTQKPVISRPHDLIMAYIDKLKNTKYPIINLPNINIKHEASKEENYDLDTHKHMISNTFIKKKLLLEKYKPIYPKILKNTRKVNLVQCSSPDRGELDPLLLSILSTNLLNILNTASDNKEILNEFNRHISRARISHEEPIHKCAVEKARIIKRTYFTSDT